MTKSGKQEKKLPEGPGLRTTPEEMVAFSAIDLKSAADGLTAISERLSIAAARMVSAPPESSKFPAPTKVAVEKYDYNLGDEEEPELQPRARITMPKDLAIFLTGHFMDHADEQVGGTRWYGYMLDIARQFTLVYDQPGDFVVVDLELSGLFGAQLDDWDFYRDQTNQCRDLLGALYSNGRLLKDDVPLWMHNHVIDLVTLLEELAETTSPKTP